MTLRFSSRHRGRKVWPRWLETRAPIAVRSDAGATFTGRLPTYPSNVAMPSAQAALEGLAQDPAPVAQAPADPEDFFAAHRWNFLLKSALTGSPGPAAALDECRRWIASNQDTESLAWEPYSACERVANLLVFLAVTRATRAESSLLRQLFGFVEESLSWIYRHLEYYGPLEAFNHILNNARALVMAGVATGNERALVAGITIFRQCLPELVGRGGFLRERSSHYQLIVLSWVLDAWHFCAFGRGESSEEAQFLRGYADRMLSAASGLCQLPGPFITIGDVSPDGPPAQSLARLSRLYPDLWPTVRGTCQPVQLVDGWIRITAREERVVAQFPSGTYPFGFLTHGHCDLTSFVWHHGSREVLADCGRYRYTPDALSMFQKSASGHNVALVNGLAPVCETLVSNGQWWPLPYARAELEAFEHNGGVTLIHTGYARATPVTRHARHIAPEEMGIDVVDSFEGSGRVELTFCWQFGDGFDRFEADDMVVIGADARVELRVEGVAGGATVESTFGGQPGGWMSREYGQKRAALGIRLRWLVNLPAAVRTRFRFVSCAAS